MRPTFWILVLAGLSAGCGLAVPEWSQPQRPGGSDRNVSSTAPGGESQSPTVGATAAELGYDIELTVLPARLQVASGSSVTGRLEVFIVGEPGLPVELRIASEGLPHQVLAQLMPASLAGNGVAVFSIRPTADLPPSETVLELEATIGRLRRRISVPLAINP